MATRLSPENAQSILRATLQEAAARGDFAMGKMVAAARLSLNTREAATRDLRERDALAQSAKQLRMWEPELCKRYPKLLREAFSRPKVSTKAAKSVTSDLQFDQLELMDESQVVSSVTLARVHQVVMLAVEASLSELNALVCTTLGLGSVQPERNPLRPEVFIDTLKELLEQTQLPAPDQLEWMAAMGAALGRELRDLYQHLCTQLRGQGVAAAHYAVLQTPLGQGIGRGIAQELRHGAAPLAPGAPGQAAKSSSGGAAAPAPERWEVNGDQDEVSDSSLLTLDKLRRLLTGELDTRVSPNSKEDFARRFAMEFENGPPVAESGSSDFHATVPAALEALKEMEAVDDMVQRLEQRRRSAPTPAAGHGSVEAVRHALRNRAQGVAQALSLEVIGLLVENIANDTRLLEPVQQLVRQIEPALLRLSLVDPRLFSNKQHPARILVQELTHRSMAYASDKTPGFEDFVRDLQQSLAPLLTDSIESAEPFERVLAKLQKEWDRVTQERLRSSAGAMQVLRHAEQRNLLAEHIAREIDAHPDAAMVPEVVIEFLCGPWAQVVAQARIVGGTGSTNAEKYHALISALLWSTHPQINRRNISKLTRLVPLLLATLREGLESIHYPATKTSAFLEALMGLHQLAFRAAQKPAEESSAPAPRASSSSRAQLLESGNPWVAPEEAQASNFIELPDSQMPPSTPVEAPDVAASAEALDATEVRDTELMLEDLPLGSWVELLHQGEWIRTQLTWASPHGTLFLFTSAVGTTQSMSRRSRDKLVQAGKLRVISDQPMVDGALNAVAQKAMYNSVHARL
ncbi:MAG: DUF1631 family protein [Burkholderiales bacterium]|nr:DUF1631 family protein [Burkholderiales bacterium]